MKRYILTGRRGAGKTTFCDTLTNFAKDRGVQLAGLLTFTVRDEGLIVLDLGGGGRKLLAKSAWGGASERKSEGVPQTNRWVFFPDILEWGNRKIRGAAPADLFILDEAGILEFQKGQGWTDGLLRVDSGVDRVCLIVVRRELVETALKRWSNGRVLEIDGENRQNEALLIREILEPLL